MTNDAKLGMLVGVLGVIVAAVLFAKQPSPSAQSQPGASEPLAQQKSPPVVVATGAPAAVRGELLSTPVARTRKEAVAQPASRQPEADEEP